MFVELYKCIPNHAAVVGFCLQKNNNNNNNNSERMIYVKTGFKPGESDQEIIRRAWAGRGSGNKQKPLLRATWCAEIDDSVIGVIPNK